MVVTAVMIQIKPDFINQFTEATIKNHEAAVKEKGNLRFDVLQNNDDPSCFMLYEVYDSEESAAAHKKTAHYLEWRQAVADWMQKPREGVPYTVIRPLEKNKWK